MIEALDTQNIEDVLKFGSIHYKEARAFLVDSSVKNSSAVKMGGSGSSQFDSFAVKDSSLSTKVETIKNHHYDRNSGQGDQGGIFNILVDRLSKNKGGNNSVDSLQVKSTLEALMKLPVEMRENLFKVN